MDIKTVFTDRIYTDNALKTKSPMFAVVEANLCKAIRENLEIDSVPSFKFLPIDDSRCEPTAGILLVDSTDMIIAYGSHQEVKTTIRAACYAEYIAFVQRLFMQIYFLDTQQELEKFGFNDRDEAEDEVQRLSNIYEDLRLVVNHNVCCPFTKEEVAAIRTLLD